MVEDCVLSNTVPARADLDARLLLEDARISAADVPIRKNGAKEDAREAKG